MDFVDEQNRILVVLHLGHHGLQAFLEIASIASASQQRAHIKAVNRGLGQNLWHFFHDDLVSKAFGDGRFANARIPHQQRVVLAAAAQDLNAAFYFLRAADQRVNVTLSRLFVQIHAVFGQR